MQSRKAAKFQKGDGEKIKEKRNSPEQGHSSVPPRKEKKERYVFAQTHSENELPQRAKAM